MQATKPLLFVFTLSMLDFSHCVCPTIISRVEWHARVPEIVTPLSATPPYIVVHHSDTPGCNTKSNCMEGVRNIQNYHMDNRKWKDIGYNFLVGGDGNVYEGRGWGVKGAHVPKYNARSIGVCLIGNFQNSPPPTIQLDALKALISCAETNNKVIAGYHLIGHRQGSSTKCPGDKLYEEISTWPHFDRNPS